MANDINVNRFVIAVVSIAVSIILIAGVMIPVMEDVTNTDNREILTNTGTPMRPVTDNETIVISNSGFDSIYGEVFLTINDDPAIEIAGEWTSENDVDVRFYPILTFTTADGKKGVEGMYFGDLTTGTDTVYFEITGGAIYIRYIDGAEYPEYYYIFTNDEYNGGTIQITNGVASYTFADTESTDIPTQINAKYELIITDSDTDATYVMTDEANVYSDTPVIFTCAGGSNTLETNPDTGDREVTGDCSLGIGFGNATTIESNLKTWGSDNISIEAVVIENSDAYAIAGNHDTKIIVPVTVGGSESSVPPTLASLLWVIPMLMIIGIVIAGITVFIRKQ